MPAFRCVCPFCGEEPRKGERHVCKPLLQEVRNASSPVDKVEKANKVSAREVAANLKSASDVLEDFLFLMEPSRHLQKTSHAMSRCGGADFLVSFLLAVAPGCFYPIKDPKRALVAAVATLQDSACRTLQRHWRQRFYRLPSRPGTVPKNAFEPAVPALVQVTPEMRQALGGGSGWANDLFQEFLGGLGKTGICPAVEGDQMIQTVTPQTPLSTSAGMAPSSLSSVTGQSAEPIKPQAPAAPKSANGSKRPKRSSSRTEASSTPSPNNLTANVAGTFQNETTHASTNEENVSPLRLESKWDNSDGSPNDQAIQIYADESVFANLEYHDYDQADDVQPALTPLERRALRGQTAPQSQPALPPAAPPSPSVARALPTAAATNRLNERLQRRKEGAESRWRTELGTRDPTSNVPIAPEELNHVQAQRSSSCTARKDALARLQNKQAQRQQDVELLEV